MVKATSRKAPTKYDLIIKAKATTTKIVDITNNSVRIESNDKGQVTGKYYSGAHWDTVEATMLADGTATMTIKFMHMTNKGESIIGSGTGTQEAPDQKGVARISGEGTMFTTSPRLTQVNGGRWKVEGEADIIKETVVVRGNIETTSQ